MLRPSRDAGEERNRESDEWKRQSEESLTKLAARPSLPDPSRITHRLPSLVGENRRDGNSQDQGPDQAPIMAFMLVSGVAGGGAIGYSSARRF